jgi:hypothetical protein
LELSVVRSMLNGFADFAVENELNRLRTPPFIWCTADWPQLDFPAPISSQCSRSPFNEAIKIGNKSSGGRGALSSHPSRGSVTSAVSG